MKGNKWFRFFYLVILLVFAGALGALAVQFGELRQGDRFYRQTAKAAAAEEVSRFPRYVSELAGEYPGLAAWLQIPGTSVNYPVMSGMDNQYYLNHLPDGRENVCGSLFLDCRSDKESFHFIIYGHNGADGKMFGLLKQYESENYFKEHSTFHIITSDSFYVCPVFSVRRVKADGEVYRLKFRDKEELEEYARQAAAESMYAIDADFSNMAGIVTLSTCTGWRNQRLIVQAVLPLE